MLQLEVALTPVPIGFRESGFGAYGVLATGSKVFIV